MNVDSDERRVVTWAEVGLVVPFVGQGRGYASWCEQVWRGITLAALACIPEGGSVKRTPLPGCTGHGSLSSASESRLSSASKRKPHSLRS